MELVTGFDLCRAALAVSNISAPEQSVLMVLAIMADKRAQCWPGINGPMGLTAKTKLSERAVQNAVKALTSAGHLTRDERPGKGVLYTVHPRTSCAPAHDAPVQEMRPAGDAPTPAPPAPKQPRTTTSSKTSSSPKSAGKPAAFALPADIPADEWADFENMRRSIRKPMTDAARHKAIARLRLLAEDGHPPGTVLSHSTLNNYQGLIPPKDHRNAEHRTDRGPANRQVDGFTSGLRRASANLEARNVG
ncbi:MULTISPECIES: hypothetical protein [unclassified Sphingomonas]|uniref:hypothetical protein n=1 Tax=unclassified Sphingomonas TaxID=196159 RepID=UPI002269A3DD|nr:MULTISPECIES: hypothetical protein [unclassified Sphingomonas]